MFIYKPSLLVEENLLQGGALGLPRNLKTEAHLKDTLAKESIIITSKR